MLPRSALRIQRKPQSNRLIYYRCAGCLVKTSYPKQVVFSGIQPTGIPHIGNYLGAIHQWIQLQKQLTPPAKLIFSIVDLHALTLPQNKDRLQQWKKQTLAILLAVGLDPSKCTIFFQSDVPAHTQLMWILSCTSSVGYLSRMTQWKSKLSLPIASKFDESAVKSQLKLGLFSYPVLQAADILVHGATHVPVGQDQKQHIEFARECASSFNHIYGRILKQPEILLSNSRRVMSLRNPLSKMSKSSEDAKSSILLTDAPEDIRNKIRWAVTDSNPILSYDPIGRPGTSNLLEILCHFDDECVDPFTMVDKYQGISMRALKDIISNKLINALAPIRDRYQVLIEGNDTLRLDEIANDGAIRAKANSQTVLNKVNTAIGL